MGRMECRSIYEGKVGRVEYLIYECKVGRMECRSIYEGKVGRVECRSII